ncbi:MAG: carbohydrate kinase family protein [Geothrix sp.]|uniref:carbohydrate kinase family protein n=1 Tax=Geothrix sp. TaxID=1962974 RepID=UPI003BB1BED3
MEGLRLSTEVVVLGCAGVDTNVFLPGREVDWSVEANFTDNLDTPGQAGVYASRGYAALGRRVAFIGNLGDDACGALVREAFARDGIDVRGVFTDPAGTARSVNVMYPDGRRKNFYDARANSGLRPDPARCREVMAGARLVHSHLADWARHLLPMARELGLVVACDLQDVVDPGDPYRQDFIREADILFFSAANHADPSPLIRRFLRDRPERIVISGMGAKGCALGTRKGIRFFPPEPSAMPLVDTNGAGDSLAVGFLTSYVLEGRPLAESIRRGQLAARHCCSLRGTSEDLISARALAELTLEPSPEPEVG